MSNGLLKIGKPQVRIEKDKAVLAAMVEDNGQEKELTYKVDKRYGKYLTLERSDAFVVALLYYAMVKKYDIEWETPCTERLIFQLQMYYIPIISQVIPFMNNISLIGNTETENLPKGDGVGTAISGGVDSTYTIYKFLSPSYKENKLTHVMFTDCFATDFSDEYQKDFLTTYLSIIPKQAEELNLDFIFVQFHVDELFSIGRFKDKERGEIADGGLYTLKYCSIVIALQKLFKIYYFSSGTPAPYFTWVSKDTDEYDLFTLPMVSTDNLVFYSSGAEVNRNEKVRKIADWNFAQNHIQVCGWENNGNCGVCGKCVRTMSELYAIGKLDLYKKRFPVEEYKKKLSRRWAYIFTLAHTGHLDEKQAIEEMKRNHRKIPIGAYMLFPFYRIKEMLRVHFRTVSWARRIYRKFHLDKLLYGRSTEQYIQSVDKEILKKGK